ncbi:DMT family transporter [Pelistega ratti]|uniref:DMT family transporter n=1 Tax=Pelistega ratti TaxID=2652177 RepID=UPI00135A3DAF|nr:DMT family transporter [Pelistega ratti]
MNNSSYLKGILFCLIATVSWGTMFPIMTDALTHLDPFNFTTLRYGIAGLAFAVLMLAKEGKESFNLKGEKWGLAWLFGTFGFAGFGFLVFWGQHLAGPKGALTASIMMATMPMLSILTIWVLKKVRPHISTVFFILLSFSGVFLVLSNGDLYALINSPTNLTANTLIILGALCWVLYTIGGSHFPHWSPVRYTTLTTLLGMISVISIDLFLMATHSVQVPSFTSVVAVIPHLLYMAFIAGLVAVLCWNMGNRILTPTNGVLFMDIVPITAFFVSFLNNVVASNVQLIGASITVIALILNNLNQHRLIKFSKT